MRRKESKIGRRNSVIDSAPLEKQNSETEIEIEEGKHVLKPPAVRRIDRELLKKKLLENQSSSPASRPYSREPKGLVENLLSLTRTLSLQSRLLQLPMKVCT